MKLSECNALVTGGAVRIGRAICEALAARGCGVAIHCDRSAAEAETLRAQLRAAGGSAWVVQGHLQSEQDCESLMDRAWTLSGGLSILVNNASVFHRDALAAAGEKELREELQINALVPILLTRAFARRVGSGGTLRGKVVNLLDRRVARPEAGCIPYLLAKKMLADFTQAAALELAPAIAVNGVAPGAILPPPDAGSGVPVPAGPSPLRRQCTSAEVAEAVVFLLENDAVTGQILYVDGGQHLL
jgi:pteridine reductase